MDQIIFKYIAGSGELSLKGIGRFKLEQEAATPDVSEQQMRPPVTVTRFYNETVSEDYLLTRYIARHFVLPEEEARKKLQAYTRKIIDQLDESGTAGISTLGEIKKEPDDHLSFTAQKLPEYLMPVNAVRSIRQDEVHMIRVGEDQKTNVEMTDFYAETPRRKLRWWIVPLVIGILAAGYLGWHFFLEHGPLGSQQKIPVK